MAGYVGQRLGVRADRQDAGGAVEPDRRQVGEQGVGGRPAGRGGPQHGIADADDLAAVGGAAGQWLSRQWLSRQWLSRQGFPWQEPGAMGLSLAGRPPRGWH